MCIDKKTLLKYLLWQRIDTDLSNEVLSRAKVNAKSIINAAQNAREELAYWEVTARHVSGK
jgi:hypothetical protein